VDSLSEEGVWGYLNFACGVSTSRRSATLTPAESHPF